MKIPRSGYLFAAALAGAVLGLIEITDAFELPFESLISIHNIVNVSILAGTTSGYLGLFALMFLESASLPIPSEVVLPLAGYLVFRGEMSFAGALAVSTAAGILGGLADYFLALVLGRPLVYRLAGRVGVSTESLERAERWLNGKGGDLTIFVARFVPGIRSSISLPAGAFKMKLLDFTIMTLLGCLGWSALLIYAGYSAGLLWQKEAQLVSVLIAQVIVYVIAVASIGYMVYYVVTLALKRRGDLPNGRK